MRDDITEPRERRIIRIFNSNKNVSDNVESNTAMLIGAEYSFM
jgi:hypothetical protein